LVVFGMCVALPPLSVIWVQNSSKLSNKFKDVQGSKDNPHRESPPHTCKHPISLNTTAR
jgi:hypothetical protein